jgi:hypothetical protein
MTPKNIFDNAELLGQVLEFSTIGTCARLTSTSRKFFREAASRVWGDLTTPSHLIFLIPDVQRTTSRQKNTTVKVRD